MWLKSAIIRGVRTCLQVLLGYLITRMPWISTWADSVTQEVFLTSATSAVAAFVWRYVDKTQIPSLVDRYAPDGQPPALDD